MQSVRKMLFALLATVLIGFTVTAVAGAQSGRLDAGPSFPDSKPLEPLPCTPVIGVNPDPVDFGSVPVGQTATLDVVLSDNEATVGCSIRVENVELTTGSIFFELLGLPTFPIDVAVGASFTFRVRFSPSQAGQLNGTMTVTTNDPVTPVKLVQLSGVGTANAPPVCNAGGPYVGFVGQEVLFDGTGSSDPDGTIESYAWTFGDGGSGTGVAPRHTYATAGDFTVTLTVTDNGGLPSECSVTASIAEQTSDRITVTAPNGGEEFAPGELTPVTWTSEGDIPLVDIDLSIDGGTTFEAIGVSEQNDGSFDWTVPNRPSTSARVRVKDSADGNPADVSDANFTINGVRVTRPNGAEPFVIGTVEAITWQSFGTEIANVRVELSRNGGFSYTDIEASTPNDGTYDWTVTGDPTNEGIVRISDAANALATDVSDASFSIVEAGGNLPPVCAAGGPYAGTVDVAVAFDGTGSSDPDGTIASYAWSFGDGASGSGPTPSHTYTAAGSFEVTLTVTDDLGATSTCSAEAVIAGGGNLPPVCAAGGPYAGTVDVAVAFDGTGSSDPDGTIASYAWSFGDGASGSGPTPSHTYTATGSFEVTLIITDDLGATSTCTTDATIGPSPGGAVRVAVPPRTLAGRGSDVSIPVFILDDVTGLGIIATEVRLAYNPKVLSALDLSFLGTIGEGGISQWSLEHRNENEDILRVSIAWVEPLVGCGELVNVLFQMTTRSEHRSYLDLEITFNEGTPAASAHDGEVVKGLLGDVNGSSQVSAIDATLIMQETVGIIHLPDPRYPNFTEPIADVSGNNAIHAYDAALILQYVLGIIDHFPAEESGLSCDDGRHMPVGRPGAPRELALEWLSPTEVVLVLDDGGGILGVELSLTFDPAVARAVLVTPARTSEDLFIESRIGAGRIDLAAAMARPASGRAELARIRFAAAGSRPVAAAIESPSLNEGLVPVVAVSAPLAGAPDPGSAGLGQNHPNPFNPATQIRYTVLAGGPVDLSIFDLAGRRVRTLVRSSVPAGTHTAEWNGRDDAGRSVAAGVYIYTLDAAGVTTTRKMTLLK